MRAGDLGSDNAEAGAVEAIVFLSADREGPPQLDPVPPATTIARLLDHTLNGKLYGDRGLKVLARVASRAEAFELTGGSSSERAALLRDRLA
jgi:hypothetical protein